MAERDLPKVFRRKGQMRSFGRSVGRPRRPEMKKREGRPEFKDLNKLKELGKAKREVEVVAEDRAAFIKRMTEKQVAFYKTVLEEDYAHLYIPEDLMAYHPAGPDAAKALNDFVRQEVKDFKELAAERIKEYNEKSYLEAFPPAGLLSPDFPEEYIEKSYMEASPPAGLRSPDFSDLRISGN